MSRYGGLSVDAANTDAGDTEVSAQKHCCVDTEAKREG